MIKPIVKDVFSSRKSDPAAGKVKWEEQQEILMVEPKAITEENFIDAFNLKLASGQERIVTLAELTPEWRI